MSSQLQYNITSIEILYLKLKGIFLSSSWIIALKTPCLYDVRSEVHLAWISAVASSKPLDEHTKDMSEANTLGLFIAKGILVHSLVNPIGGTYGLWHLLAIAQTISSLARSNRVKIPLPEVCWKHHQRYHWKSSLQKITYMQYGISLSTITKQQRDISNPLSIKEWSLIKHISWRTS